MRIVNTDNFDSDHPSESFVLHPMNEEAAEEIADVINKHFSGPHSERFWKVVSDNYKLN